MEDLSLHILDIAENSISAGARRIRIKIIEDIKKNLLLIEISDNGKGMDREMFEHACDPFYTTRTTRRVGLGIPLLAQAARECMGDIKISTEKGKGSTITATFQYNHIDRKPLGDIGKTMIVLIASNPDIDFIFEHKKNGNSYILDTANIKKELDGVPINTPAVIKIIKDDISAWLNTTDNMIE
ncbi:MAG TPA: ATP-binding protein [Nitrospirae bacterium]|nr:CAI-1 autoinducer sensor kinase/phosphatase CqsS [bacterium BMS3Abin06]HDH11757.1 ATP-binding protein [Nitrospirota bacterium]HDZ02593.1 ATP-binding protein [Nitrospirota bacterium]